MRVRSAGIATVVVAVASGCVGLIGVGDLREVDCTKDCDTGAERAEGGGDTSQNPAEAGDDDRDASPADGNVEEDSSPSCDGSFQCGNTCVNDCAGQCDGSLACRSSSTCVTSCDNCGISVECFSCGNPGSPPMGTCEPYDAASAGTLCPPPTQHDCPCVDSGDCPGQEQVCAFTWVGLRVCRPCGSPGTDKGQCSDGFGCQQLLRPPRCQ
jgi:hypothetical protein